jgi:hypothetical protein
MAGDSKDTMTVKAGDPDRYVQLSCLCLGRGGEHNAAALLCCCIAAEGVG